MTSLPGLEIMAEVKELEARLDRLLKNRPDLEEAAALQRELLRECYRTPPRAEPPILPRDRARQKLVDGVPLLHGEDVALDLAFCRDLFGRLLNALQRRPESAEAAAEIAHAAATGRLDFERALGEALVNHPEHLVELATWAAVPADVLASVLELVVRPPLQALALALKPLLQEIEHWDRRLECAFCGNDDHRSLGYLQGEREPRFRVEICERCRGYLKSANAFESSPAEYLVLDDLASVHLDIAALERGYSRPATAGFRLELGDEHRAEAVEDLLESD
jgi:hypothetical protein